MANTALSLERASSQLPDHGVARPTTFRVFTALLSHQLDNIKSGAEGLFKTARNFSKEDAKTLTPRVAVGAGSLAVAAGVATGALHLNTPPAAAQTENISQISADDPRFNPPKGAFESRVAVGDLGKTDGSVRQEEGEVPPDNLPADPAVVGDQSEITAGDPNRPKPVDIVENASSSPQRTDGTKGVAPSSSAPPPETPALSAAEAPVETDLSNLAEQFSPEARDARLESLKGLSVLWTKDTNPDLYKDGEAFLKLLIATYKPAPGNGAEFLEKLIRQQNNEETRGNLQHTIVNSRFMDGYMFTIDDKKPEDGGLPIKFGLVNNLVIDGQRVQSVVLITVNSRFSDVVRGVAPALKGKSGDLTSATTIEYTLATPQVLNRLLSEEASAYSKMKNRRVSPEELREHLASIRIGLTDKAKEIGEERAILSSRKLLEEMPDYWYVGPALQDRLGN